MGAGWWEEDKRGDDWGRVRQIWTISTALLARLSIALYDHQQCFINYKKPS